MPHVTRLNTTPDQILMGRYDVGDDQGPSGRTQRCCGYSLAEGD